MEIEIRGYTVCLRKKMIRKAARHARANLFVDRKRKSLDQSITKLKYKSFKKDIWSIGDMQQLFLKYKKYGNHWKAIASFYQGQRDRCIKNRFYNLAKKAFRTMLRLTRRKTQFTFTKTATLIHTKSWIHTLNSVIKLDEDPRRVVVLDVIEKYAFMDFITPGYEPDQEETKLLNTIIDLVFTVNESIKTGKKVCGKTGFTILRTIESKHYLHKIGFSFEDYVRERELRYKEEEMGSNRYEVGDVGFVNMTLSSLDIEDREKKPLGDGEEDEEDNRITRDVIKKPKNKLEEYGIFPIEILAERNRANLVKQKKLNEKSRIQTDYNIFVNDE